MISIHESRLNNSIRLSRRLSRSIIRHSVNTIETNNDVIINDNNDQIETDHIKSSSSLLRIIRYAKNEWPLIVVAFVFTLVRGCIWPLFTIIYGKMFQVCKCFI